MKITKDVKLLGLTEEVDITRISKVVVDRDVVKAHVDIDGNLIIKTTNDKLHDILKAQIELEKKKRLN